MKKYHINDNNEVNECTAHKEPCKFASDSHFNYHGEAVIVAEMRVAEQFDTFTTAKKDPAPAEEPEEGSYDTPSAQTVDIRADRLDKVHRSIERANRRLAAAGIEDRFEYTVETYKRRKVDPQGFMREEERATITLNRPRISYNGFEFQARVEKLDSGKLIAYSAPGVELDGWTPESMECEKCQKKIHRSKVYVVKDEDGKMTTVGGQCVELYTGLSPKSLWGMEYDLKDTIPDEDMAPTPDDSAPIVEKTDNLLAVSYVLTKENGYQNANSDNPTSQSVGNVLYPQTKEQEQFSQKILEEAEKVDADTIRREVETALKDAQGDWAHNVRTLMGEEYINSRGRGILVSSMAALHRARREKEKPTWKKGFLGAEKEKIKDISAKVEKVNVVPGNYGSVALITMRTDDDYRVFWRSSSDNIPNRGDNIVFNATVKGNDTYKGVDSTVIIRPKWEAVESEDDDGSEEDTDEDQDN